MHQLVAAAGLILDNCAVLAYVAAYLDHFRFQHNVNARVLADFLNGLLQQLLWVSAIKTDVDMAQVPAQFGFLFYQKNRETLGSDGERRGHASQPAANDQGLVLDVQGAALDRAQMARFRNRHGNKLFGFVSGNLWAAAMHPGVLLSDVRQLK